jgi:predicted secreted protein
MNYFKLDYIQSLTEGTMISFNDGELRVHEQGHYKSWEVHLDDINDDKFLQKMMRSKEKILLKFITEEQREFQGTVIISHLNYSSNGSSAELTGTGELIGY